MYPRAPLQMAGNWLKAEFNLFTGVEWMQNDDEELEKHQRQNLHWAIFLRHSLNICNHIYTRIEGNT